MIQEPCSSTVPLVAAADIEDTCFVSLLTFDVVDEALLPVGFPSPCKSVTGVRYESRSSSRGLAGSEGMETTSRLSWPSCSSDVDVCRLLAGKGGGFSGRKLASDCRRDVGTEERGTGFLLV